MISCPLLAGSQQQTDVQHVQIPIFSLTVPPARLCKAVRSFPGVVHERPMDIHHNEPLPA